LTGSQVKIKTDDRHSQAEIINIDNERIESELEQGKIVVVAGFQGVNANNDFTTLGRGGSDTTCVALAASLKADRCEIYSDVEGIFTADPQIVPEARKLNYISFKEMLELSNLGAEVLHPRAVELAKHYGLDLYIASSFKNKPGTIVRRSEKMENNKNVTGVTSDLNEVKITVQEVPDQPGVAGRLFTRLADNNINVDMIIQNLQHNNLNDITFTISNNDLKQGKDVIEKIARELGSGDILIDEEVAKVSIVGAGMISTPGIAARMFETLGEANINIQMITTADIKISCLINEEMAEKAVRVVHETFALDKENGAA
ncbi:MAG: aspartate kinase, partial [Halanaerobiales bacterium]